MYIPQNAYTRYRASQTYMEMSGQINFHKIAIADIKRRLGDSCSYLSHLSKKKVIQVEIENEEVEIENEEGEKSIVNKVINQIYFLAHLKINNEKRVVRVDTGLVAGELVAENYKALLTQLSDYVTGKKNI